MCTSLPRGGRRPTPANLVLQACNSVNLELQACNAPLESKNSHFFKWLFTKMAHSVVGGWESGFEQAGIPLMRTNTWIWLRTSSSFVCNKPSLQIRSFGGNRSATSSAILPINVSALSWWNKSCALRIVPIYRVMKLMNTVCLSHLICCWCLAMEASPKCDTFCRYFH